MSINTVKINGADNFVWTVTDSKMDRLIKYLNWIGKRKKVTFSGDCNSNIIKSEQTT